MDGKVLLVCILYGHGVIFVPLVHCLIYEYHFINTPVTWSEAQQYCRENFTDLATIEREEDLSKLAIPSGQWAWIGLHDNPAAWKNVMTADPNSWRWSATGTTSPGGYQNWALTQPDNYNAGESCVYIKNNMWADYSCKGSAPCACYKDQSGVKEFFLIKNIYRTWAECQSVCRQQYQDLAMIESEAENQALGAKAGQTATWIGLYREPWLWSDLSSSSYRKWLPGSPNNYGGRYRVQW
ncbi:macrophage mannose receptor 1-like [Boleophthalmus pectinirostris]|uniref:macrophage mannose receptor 1-like n=1 Tax=Boleophthalmus pectinirostris TaxID=150288 RepID=UPI00242C993C|nr:macrophage mannose receptor 1-like [Boleophthalmus pectinirostris]